MNYHTPEKYKKVKNFFWQVGYFLKLIHVYCHVKYFFQYLIRGFSDRQAWSLDITVAKFIIPRLKRLKEIGLAYPPPFNSMLEWHNTIDKMIWSFEYVLSDYGSVECSLNSRALWRFKEIKNMKRFEEGMNLFAKYYKDLWL